MKRFYSMQSVFKIESNRDLKNTARQYIAAGNRTHDFYVSNHTSYVSKKNTWSTNHIKCYIFIYIIDKNLKII